MHNGPHLAEIRLHPIKSLDAVGVPESRIGPGGGLELDRVWAIYSEDGQFINGKSTAAIHRIRAAYAPDVTIEIPRNACGFYEFWRAEELIALGRERAAQAFAKTEP